MTRRRIIAVGAAGPAFETWERTATRKTRRAVRTAGKARGVREAPSRASSKHGAPGRATYFDRDRATE
jgi:hypothetical protein